MSMRPTRAIASLACFAAIAGCAQILGIDGDTASVVVDFCKCKDLEERWPGETCQDHVTGRLSTADPAVVAQWLELYEEQSCRSCTSSGREACAAAEPLCVHLGGSCANTSVCCGSVAAVYCGENQRCVTDEACLPPGSVCQPGGSPCCGAAGLNASCEADATGVLRCLEVCDFNQEVNNCPGCCGHYTEVSEAGVKVEAGLCSATTESCALICNPEVNDACLETDLDCLPNLFKISGDVFSLDLCTRPCNPGGPGTECASPDCCVRYADASGAEFGVCVFDDGRNRICAERCNLPGEECAQLLQECALVPVPGDEGYSAYVCVPRKL